MKCGATSQIRSRLIALRKCLAALRSKLLPDLPAAALHLPASACERYPQRSTGSFAWDSGFLVFRKALVA